MFIHLCFSFFDTFFLQCYNFIIIYILRLLLASENDRTSLNEINERNYTIFKNLDNINIGYKQYIMIF